MTQDQATPNSGDVKTPHQKALAKSHYALLGLYPSASVREIRQAYRELSKLYHPDTTNLPTAIATTKFQQLNEAYATLTSPERRSAYDRKIGYSSIPVVQPLPSLNRSSMQNRASQSSSAYLDATDRPLSPGEIFALFILGITFIGCLFLAIAVGITRGESLLQPTVTQGAPVQQVVPSKSTSTNKFTPNRKPSAIDGTIPADKPKPESKSSTTTQFTESNQPANRSINESKSSAANQFTEIGQPASSSANESKPESVIDSQPTATNPQQLTSKPPETPSPIVQLPLK